MRMVEGFFWGVTGLGVIGGLKTADVLYDRHQTSDSYTNSATVIEDCFTQGQSVVAVLPSDARPIEVTSCATGESPVTGFELQPGDQQIFVNAATRVDSNVRTTGLAIGALLTALEVGAVSAAVAARHREL